MQSCTSLSDFKKMSPDTRAKKACNNDTTVKFYTNKYNNATHRLNKINNHLSKGYKAIQTCDTSTIYYPVKDPKTNKRTVEQSLQENCTTHIVPLTEYATNNMLTEKSELNHTISIAQKKIDPAFNSCFEKLKTFNARDAYDYYKN